ncbi:MAG: group II intron reverse transcriptase/maturase [Symploca sp. SIO2G7]|nr:group II intron reverse transcriptase/maturase [Symploca sp. SIO2G7]
MNKSNTNKVEWNTIQWKQIHMNVFKLQKSIYQATLSEDFKVVHTKQKLLIKSWSAKLLAVRRVTQDNRGKATAGIDGVKSISPKQRLRLAENLMIDGKASPTRRIWIPKPGKEETRPLSIPTIEDRAKQALVKMALEPEWEAKFEPNSFGFRPGRSAIDIVRKCVKTISKNPKYILDADIEKCFDKINHNYLLEKLRTYPQLRQQIKAWLQAGVIDDGEFFATDQGSPQGGVISPLLANIALHGMEYAIRELAQEKPGRKANVEHPTQVRIFRYADDFIVLHPSFDFIEEIKDFIENWLSPIGLRLKEEKTTIRNSLYFHDGNKPGVDFLGFNIRAYPAGKYRAARIRTGVSTNLKAYAKPSKESVKRHVSKLAHLIKKYRGRSAAQLIVTLSSKINGWARYYHTERSSRTFTKVDYLMHRMIINWTKWQHPHKPRYFREKKYYRYIGTRKRFSYNYQIWLPNHEDTHIVKKFTSVNVNRSPYDGDWVYWGTRMKSYPGISPKLSHCLSKQKGICPECELHFTDGDIIEVDHILPRSKGGRSNKENLQALHAHCHDKKTSKDRTTDKAHCNEEPCDGKPSRTVLKPSSFGDKVT